MWWDVLESVDWGDAPGWVAAIGTVGTLALAVSGLWYELHSRRSEQRDREAAQARLIAATIDPLPLGGGVVIRLTNHSTAPIFGVRIEGLRMSPGEPVTRWANGETGEWLQVAPGETVKATLLLILPAGGEFERYIISSLDSYSAQIEFIDAAGLRWNRVGGHAPQRLTEVALAPPDRMPPLLSELDFDPRDA